MSETTDEYLNYMRMLMGGLRDIKNNFGRNQGGKIKPKNANTSKTKSGFDGNAKLNKWHKKYSEVFFNGSPFVWVGSSTDLCYFYERAKLPYSLLDELDKTHPVTARRTKNAMEQAVEKGWLKRTEYEYIMTSEGYKHITSKAFMGTAKQELKNAKIGVADIPVIKQEDVKFRFEGKESDMRVFNAIDEFDVNEVCGEIFNVNPSLANKVNVNFRAWAEKGYVNLLDNGRCSLTTMGLEFMNSNEFKKIADKGSGSYKTETIVGDVTKAKDMPYSSYYTVFNDITDVECTYADYLSTVEDDKVDAYKAAFEKAKGEGLYDNFNKDDWFFAVSDNDDKPKVIYGSRKEWTNNGLIKDGALTAKGNSFIKNNSTISSSAKDMAEKTAEKAENVSENAVGATVGTTLSVAKMPVDVMSSVLDNVQEMTLSK